MKSLENIFSSPKKKYPKISFCPNPKTKIIIDTREKQSLVATNLFEKGANAKFEKLEIGDYLIGNTIIERKTFSDFINSIINKRLLKQLSNIKKYPKYFLILEGFNYNYKKSNVHENVIKGMLLSIALDFQVPIIFTKNEKDTASFLILTAKRYEKPKLIDSISIRQSKNLQTLEEQKQFILEGFPGIGPTLSKKLLEKFSSLKGIFDASEKELKQIARFNENKIENFKKLLEK